MIGGRGLNWGEVRREVCVALWNGIAVAVKVGMTGHLLRIWGNILLWTRKAMAVEKGVTGRLMRRCCCVSCWNRMIIAVSRLAALVWQ